MSDRSYNLVVQGIEILISYKVTRRPPSAPAVLVTPLHSVAAVVAALGHGCINRYRGLL